MECALHTIQLARYTIDAIVSWQQDYGVKLADGALAVAERSLRENTQCLFTLAEAAVKALVSIQSTLDLVKQKRSLQDSMGRALLKGCVNPVRDVVVWRVVATANLYDRSGFLVALR